jgi:hypothetical protein
MAAPWQRRMLQVEFERWRLDGLARQPTLIDWWAPTRRLSRDTPRSALSASPLGRIVAVAAAAVTVPARAMLALVVVASA